MLKIDPGTTRFEPFELIADEVTGAPIPLAAPGVEIIATSWANSPATITSINLANGTGRLEITIPANEPPRKRHWIDLRIHIADGQSFNERVPILIGWPE